MKHHNDTRRRRHWSTYTLSALAAGGMLAAIPAVPALAGEPTHGAYTWHHFATPDGKDRPRGFDSVTFETTVDVSPGDNANVYWSNQFGFVDRNGNDKGGAY